MHCAVVLQVTCLQEYEDDDNKVEVEQEFKDLVITSIGACGVFVTAIEDEFQGFGGW